MASPQVRHVPHDFGGVHDRGQQRHLVPRARWARPRGSASTRSTRIAAASSPSRRGAGGRRPPPARCGRSGPDRSAPGSGRWRTSRGGSPSRVSPMFAAARHVPVHQRRCSASPRYRHPDRASRRCSGAQTDRDDVMDGVVEGRRRTRRCLRGGRASRGAAARFLGRDIGAAEVVCHAGDDEGAAGTEQGRVGELRPRRPREWWDGRTWRTGSCTGGVCDQRTFLRGGRSGRPARSRPR